MNFDVEQFNFRFPDVRYQSRLLVTIENQASLLQTDGTCSREQCIYFKYCMGVHVRVIPKVKVSETTEQTFHAHKQKGNYNSSNWHVHRLITVILAHKIEMKLTTPNTHLNLPVSAS